MNYYNEHDPRAAAWLRELIKKDLIPEGRVDERSIVDVRAADLVGYAQCHFFAGIGGWPLALRLAGIDDDEPLDTGSCPCQPFSSAGKRMGTKDSRHLFPAFRRIIAQRQSPVVFGEQVASGDGRQWLARVRLELETLGYVVSGAPICALRASGHRTSDKDCTGWPTPDTNQRGGAQDPAKRREGGHSVTLQDAVTLVGWNTPRATDGSNGGPNQAGGALPADAALSGWSTPTAMDHSRGDKPPRPTDTGVPLSQQAAMAGRLTPSANDDAAGNPDTAMQAMLGSQAKRAIGQPTTSSPAQTGSRGALNAHHSRWLMGFPKDWLSCGQRAFQNLKKKS